MFVIHLEHAPDSIRGEMSLFSQEVAPFTFVSNASAKTRDKLWDDILNIEKISAVMIYSAKSEFGYEVKTYGIPTYDFQDFGGLKLVRKAANERTEYLAHKLWAKLNPRKSLIDHLLETGIVSQALMDGIFSPLMRRISKITCTDIENLKSQISFICAMHDIGKAHPEFQGRDSETFDLLCANNLDQASTIRIRHEEFAIYCILDDLLKTEAERHTSKAIKQIIGMHHQKERKEKNPNLDFVEISDKKIDGWKDIHKYICNYIKNAFPFTKLDFCENLKLKKDKFTVINSVLGILITSDWIASNNEVFGTESVKNYADIEDYLNCKNFDIKGFLLRQDLIKSSFPETKTFTEIFHFNNIREIQQDVEKIVNKENVKVMLIESGCGSGKTEAALYAASVMGYKNDLSGIYMGLPTGSSAEAIQNRVDAFLDQLHMPQTRLYTSKTMLLRENGSSPAWTDASRQRLLSSSAVGTVDQVMTAARLVRFESVRMAGLSSKVLIVDEIHAYDAYMITTIERLLQICTAIGVPVILLSATLPVTTKEKLFSSITGNNVEVHNGYPLISYITEDDVFHEVQSTSSEPDKEIRCELLSYLKNASLIAKQALKNVEHGGCECVIMNTVQDAIDVYDFIKNQISDDYELILYHARMPESTKEKKIKKILKWCGKDRSNRPAKAIIVGTQVLEQSIDIDVDYMITAICPMDLLLQRIGRYHRHNDVGTIRQNNDISNVVYVLVSDNGDYGVNQKIYEKCYLETTESIIVQNNNLSIPSCIPTLINQVYSSADVETITKDRIKEADSDDGNINISYGFNSFYDKSRQGKLSDMYVKVRDSNIETTQIAILSDEEIDILNTSQDVSALIGLFKTHVVSVNSMSLRDFDGEYGDHFFKNVKIFREDDCENPDGDKILNIDEEYGFRILDM